MKKILFLFLIFSFIRVNAQNPLYVPANNFTVGFYNTENLFDTINDSSNKGDDDFLPDGKNKWSKDRYERKLADIAKIIASLNVNELPEIIGFAELENRKVLEDLIQQKTIQSGNYAIAHKESPDRRGIDCGLIYRKDEFTDITIKTFAVLMPSDTSFRTRDILYVKGTASKTEPLHIFVNHWSSRGEGEEKTKERRTAGANVLRSKVDSILKTDKNAKIVMIGDFNDEPMNESINKTLNATNNLKTKNNSELYNLMFDKAINGYGTHVFDGKWNMLDNMIVSQALLHAEKGFVVSTDGGQIYKEKWILYDNTKIGMLVPNRTYGGGGRYLGGISDHLPVYTILKKN